MSHQEISLNYQKFIQRYSAPTQTVVIAGASGMVGQEIQKILKAGGHHIRTLVRGEAKEPGQYRWNPDSGYINLEAFAGADAVIHLGGASINTRFNEKNKQKILESRVKSTELLTQELAKLQIVHNYQSSDDKKTPEPKKIPKTLIVASAIGYYGSDRPAETLVESSQPGQDFLAKVCQRWEGACAKAQEAGLRVANIRTGVVQSQHGGALKLQLPLFKAGIGGWIGSGRQMQSWISLPDIAGIYVHTLLTPELSGPINAVAPIPLSAKNIAQLVGKALNRPVLFPIPRIGPDLILGREGTDCLALADQNVSCQKLLDSGYIFFDNDFLAAMKKDLS